MATYRVGDRVCLMCNPSTTRTVVGFDGVTPRVAWDTDAAPGDDDSHASRTRFSAERNNRAGRNTMNDTIYLSTLQFGWGSLLDSARLIHGADRRVVFD